MTQQPDGFVYVQTNDADHNEVVVFARRAGGELERCNSYLTGGKGSGEPHKTKVAHLSAAQVREIAQTKMEDLNANDLEQASRIIAGTARSMGITTD